MLRPRIPRADWVDQMDKATKRTILATGLCILILFGWLKVMEFLYPHQPAETATSQSASVADAPTSGPATRPSDRAPDELTSAPEPQTVRNAPTKDKGLFRVVESPAAPAVTLGDDRQKGETPGFENPYEYAAVVSPRGGGVETVRLSRYRNEAAKDRRRPNHDPYDMLQPAVDPETGQSRTSFVTDWVRFVQGSETHTVELADANWSLEKINEEDGERAVLRTRVQRAGVDLLAVEKVYRLRKGSHHLEILLTVENLSGDVLNSVILGQRGPIGIKKEDLRSDYRRVMSAVMDGNGVVSVGKSATHANILKKSEEGALALGVADRSLTWAAVSNKYFGCIVAPLPQPTAEAPTDHPEAFIQVSGKIFSDLSTPPDGPCDMTVLLEFTSGRALEAGQSWRQAIDAYCGPKSKNLFDKQPEAVARSYLVVSNPDHSGCTFEWLSRAMLWLLTKSYGVIGNYGVAIIILVVIVRTILHPVTKLGQINMMKMQRGMAKLKPKIEAIQQQFKNDRQKLNEETMKLYREEGINPAGQVFGCLPMMLQMPVWVALWTTLNTNVDMRQEPFFSWIDDLASPDALIAFHGTYHIPLLGSMMGPITALNLLPIIMTITMYAQQKFTQKLTKPAAPTTPKTDAEGKPAPDPMAQQQKMMSFMMVFFGFLFYNFPSGLNLYILSSNLLGMVEQYRIKKHIREKEEAGEFEVKKPAEESRAGKPSLWSRLQKMADAAREGPGRGGKGKNGQRG